MRARPSLDEQINMAETSPRKASSYDINVVGGGTAGCVVANRPSGISALKILVFEAGGIDNDDAHVKTPGLFTQTIGDPNSD